LGTESTHLGSWWRVDNADEEVGGTLSIKEDGLALVLVGSFPTGEDQTKVLKYPPAEPLIAPVIVGQTDGTHHWTLLNGKRSFPRFPGFRGGTEGWAIEAAVEADLSTQKTLPPAFTGVRFGFQHMDVWSRAQGVDQTIDFNSLQVDVSATTHQLAHGLLDSGDEIEIDQGLSFEDGDAGSGYTIRQPVTLTVRAVGGQRWESLLNAWLQPLQGLLWLATTEVCRITETSVRIEQDELGPQRWAALWAPIMQPAKDKADGRIDPDDVLFFADELPGGFAAGVQKWADLWNTNRHILGPLLGRERAPFAYVNDRFATAASATEAYHFEVVGSKQDLPKAAHKARVAAVNDVLEQHAPEHKDWAVAGLPSFNKMPMWQRVLWVIEQSGEVGEQLVGTHGEFFAKQVVSARDGHAHALKGEVAIYGDPGGLYHAGSALMWVLRTLFLRDLGFESQDAQQRVSKNRSFRWTARSLRGVLDTLNSG